MFNSVNLAGIDTGRGGSGGGDGGQTDGFPSKLVSTSFVALYPNALDENPNFATDRPALVSGYNILTGNDPRVELLQAVNYATNRAGTITVLTEPTRLLNTSSVEPALRVDGSSRFLGPSKFEGAVRTDGAVTAQQIQVGQLTAVSSKIDHFEAESAQMGIVEMDRIDVKQTAQFVALGVEGAEITSLKAHALEAPEVQLNRPEGSLHLLRGREAWPDAAGRLDDVIQRLASGETVVLPKTQLHQTALRLSSQVLSFPASQLRLTTGGSLAASTVVSGALALEPFTFRGFLFSHGQSGSLTLELLDGGGTIVSTQTLHVFWNGSSHALPVSPPAVFAGSSLKDDGIRLALSIPLEEGQVRQARLRYAIGAHRSENQSPVVIAIPPQLKPVISSFALRATPHRVVYGLPLCSTDFVLDYAVSDPPGVYRTQQNALALTLAGQTLEFDPSEWSAEAQPIQLAAQPQGPRFEGQAALEVRSLAGSVTAPLWLVLPIDQPEIEAPGANHVAAGTGDFPEEFGGPFPADSWHGLPEMVWLNGWRFADGVLFNDSSGSVEAENSFETRYLCFADVLPESSRYYAAELTLTTADGRDAIEEASGIWVRTTAGGVWLDGKKTVYATGGALAPQLLNGDPCWDSRAALATNHRQFYIHSSGVGTIWLRLAFPRSFDGVITSVDFRAVPPR